MANILNTVLRRYFNLRLAKTFPRPMTRFIKQKLKDELIGVEIGVYEGEHALSMLKTLPIKKLYAIDPYEAYDNIYKHVGRGG